MGIVAAEHEAMNAPLLLVLALGAITEAALVWRLAARIAYRRGHADGVAAAAALAYPGLEGPRP
nr:hypothetical protein [Bradyrhizobium cosmicum]QDP20648.1 hypothetical protein FNV92_00105 [Bradyrhizobium cosmicum]QDP20699.1 hypothetical protein FNV92_00380 [Bradyrhizobium cosmicum]